MKTLLKSLLALLLVLGLGLAALNQFAPHTAARLAIQFERQRAHLAMHQTPIPGFSISYTQGGQINPGLPLLLIHGSGGDKDNFLRLSRQLTPKQQVISLDLPGYGDSSKPADADYRIPAQVERIAQFLDALKIPKAHLAGNSMGGFIAAAFAARYPERVASLWLLAPAGVKSSPESEARRIFRETGKSPLFAEKPEDYAAIMALVMTEVPRLPSSILRTYGERATGNYALHSRIYADIYHDPFRLEGALAGGLPMPVQIVWGEQDRVLHPGGAAILKALLPQADVQMLPGIGHVPQMEAPELVARNYLRWRSTLPN